MFVDGDEILEADAFLKITRAISQSKIDCYSFIQRNYSFQLGLEEARRAQAWPPGLPVSDRPLFYIENWMERLYRKGLGLCYEGRIHESLIPACERLHREYSRLPVVLHHYGRLKKPDPSKLHYYLELTEKKCREESQNPVPWIELCINLMEVGALEKAFSKAEEAVGKFSNQPEILRVGFQAALRTERFVLAEQWIRDFLKQRPRDLYAKAQLTTALLYQRKFPEVFSLAEEIFREEPSNFVAHLNCGVISFEEKNWKDAARHLEAASRERPDDVFVRDSLKKVMSEIQKD
jgi:tetratricopeptide (TPR) repeat protein